VGSRPAFFWASASSAVVGAWAVVGLGVVVLGMPLVGNRAKEIVMAGLLNRIKNFMRSPKGRQMTSKAQQMAKDPRNRERARQAAQKLRRKR
jgi:hypothetical protein